MATQLMRLGDPMATLPMPTESLERYIQAVNRFPVLTAEQEHDLAVALKEHNDVESAQWLVLSHLRFVVHVARSYQGYGLPLADLIQEGNIGLMKAVRRFDPELGVRLVSFAVHWIRSEIHEFILRNWRSVKVATTKAQRKLFFKLRSSKKRLGWFSEDEVQEVAADLGVRPETVREMESRLSGQDVAFDPMEDDSDESAATAPSAYLAAPNADPAALVEADDTMSHQHALLGKALDTLDERSRDILNQRWLHDDAKKATLQTLADKYNVSAERIRQLEKNAMKKVRAQMSEAA